MLTEKGLGLAVVSAGLWSGRLLTPTTILHPIHAAQDAGGFRTGLGLFLPVARRSPTNHALVAALVLAPVLGLVGLRDEPTGAPFVLTAVGLGLTVTGPLLTSRLLSEPNYDTILAWDPAAVPADWRDVRSRYSALNWIRAACTWVAFGLFLAAAYAYLR